MLTGESGYRERERNGEGRIKTNPLCEPVLVAMATIITSHLGKQELGKRRGGGGKERKNERGTGQRRGAGDRMQLWKMRKSNVTSRELCRHVK